MRAVAIALILLMTVMGLPVWAQEDANAELDAELEALLSGEEEIPIYHFPEIPPEYRLSVGYRTVTHDGAQSAAEHECLECSFVFGAEARAFTYPHRVYFVFDLESQYDYFGEFRYAWGDKFFARALYRSLFHNLERAYLDTPTAGTNISVRDRGEDYEIESGLGKYFVRFKTPDFPLHVYASHWNFREVGTEQQRNLLGSGWHNDILRTSQKREIGKNTGITDIGINSHLGYLEAEYIHREKKFSASRDDVLVDSYTSVGTFRAAGDYQHDATPKTEGKADILKVHTSYTGKWVASATVSAKERSNEDGGAEAESVVGTAGLRWMPVTNLSLVLRYRHIKNEVDTPSRVTYTDITGTNSYTFDVKEAMSSTSDTIFVTARYRPMQKLVLKGKYSYETLKRDNAENWAIQEETKKTVATVSATATLPGNMKTKVEYTYRKVEDPAYNIEPDYSNAGGVSLSWTPAMGIHTFANYDMICEKRRHLQYSATEDAEDRLHRRTRFMVGGTFAVPDGVSVTLSYAHLDNLVEQDLVAYEGAIATVEEDVKYEDESNTYALAVAYMYKSALSLGADITHTLSRGGYDADGTIGATEQFAELDFQETAFGASADYTFGSGTTLGVEYKYVERNDTEQNPYDEMEGGNAQVLIAKLTQRW